jgi:hypothetical protein
MGSGTACLPDRGLSTLTRASSAGCQVLPRSHGLRRPPRRSMPASAAPSAIWPFPPRTGGPVEPRHHMATVRHGVQPVPSARASRWVVVDRLFPSSQIHHGCGGRLLGEKLAKQLSCERCGAVVDRDENAAKNIRDWPDHANPGPVEASALREPGPPDGGTDGRSDVRGTVHRARRRKTSLSGVSVRREPMLANASGGTPQGMHLHDNYRSLRCTGSGCGMRALAEGGPRTYLRSRCPDR